MSLSSRRYCLISPCRDEQQYARRTIESVLRQTMQPALWIIVDDGSTDQTPAILAEYAARVPYIRVVRRADRGERKLGGGVIDAFYAGYDTINPDDFDYVCKFDLDLDLPPGYFEILIKRMENDPRIGTCSVIETPFTPRALGRTRCHASRGTRSPLTRTWPPRAQNPRGRSGSFSTISAMVGIAPGTSGSISR